LSSEEITSRLARYLLQVREGERLESVRQFARLNHTSVGTVSNALTSIEDRGCQD
jgi:DNA-binding transcriptional regulator YhcF (GntR family)